MSIEIDFNEYFDMVQKKTTESRFYKDIQKQFENGRIDSKTYASIITSFHSDTLKEAIAIGRDMAISVKELELKTNESEARVELSNRQKQAIGEELELKTSQNKADIDLKKSEEELNNRQKDAIDEELELKTSQNKADIDLIKKRSETEVKRAELLARQIEGFEDNLKIKKAEHSSNLYGMIESGGNEAPSSLVNLVMSSLNDI